MPHALCGLASIIVFDWLEERNAKWIKEGKEQITRRRRFTPPAGDLLSPLFNPFRISFFQPIKNNYRCKAA